MRIKKIMQKISGSFINDKYTIVPFDYVDIRSNKVLMVWGDIPFWIVVDYEFYELLNEIKNGLNIWEKIKSRGKEESQQIKQALKVLHKHGVAFVGDKNPNNSIKPYLENLPKIENITINLTSKCNLKCTFCYRDESDSKYDKSEELKSEEVIGFIKGIRKYTSSKASIIILGGEPVICKQKLLDICEAASSLGYSVLVSTNGTLVDEEFAAKLAKIKVEMQVSIDSHCQKINDKLRGKDSFNKACEGVKTLVNQGVYTIVSCVVQSSNVNFLKEYYNMALSLGVDEARFIPLKIFGRAQKNKLETICMFDIMQNAKEMFENNEELLKISKRDAFSILRDTCAQSIKKWSCGTGLQTLLLDSDGTIYPCANMVSEDYIVGNIRDENFEFGRVWVDSEKMINYRNKTCIDKLNSKCSKCFVRYWCLGSCRGESYSVFNDISLPAYNCNDMGKSIIEMFWTIAEKNN